MLNWLYVHLGIAGSGPWYGFWSGFGSDVGEIAIIGGLLTLVRHHNCHVRRCWRIKRHPVEGTPYVTCRKHHPTLSGTDHPTAEDVAAAHKASKRGVAKP